MHISGGVCLINYEHLNGDDIGINCLLICACSRLLCTWLMRMPGVAGPTWPTDSSGVESTPGYWHLRSLPLTFDAGRANKQQELDHTQCPWARRLHNRAKCAKPKGVFEAFRFPLCMWDQRLRLCLHSRRTTGDSHASKCKLKGLCLRSSLQRRASPSDAG